MITAETPSAPKKMLNHIGHGGSQGPQRNWQSNDIYGEGR